MEQLIVEGVGKGKEGSVCQAAGWGYPCLSAPLPLLLLMRYPASHSGDALTVAVSLYFISQFSLLFHLTSPIWTCCSLAHVALWHSIFCFFHVKWLLHFLFKSLAALISSVCEEDIHLQQLLILNRNTIPHLLFQSTRVYAQGALHVTWRSVHDWALN